MSAFHFRLYWLFSFICFTRRGWPCSKITLSCIWVAIPFGWVILHRYTCCADGHTVTWLPKFLGWVDYEIFLPMVLRYNKTLPSRSQGLDFLIYVSDEEGKKLETTLKVSIAQGRIYRRTCFWILTHILSLCSLCIPVNGSCIKYHFAPFRFFYFMCFPPVINVSVLSFVKKWKTNLGHVQARALV